MLTSNKAFFLPAGLFGHRRMVNASTLIEKRALKRAGRMDTGD
ncbi:hypothetical protein [Endozoicomonas sp.]|nr:hypothetical protein [Endozoicomonas sp.]